MDVWSTAVTAYPEIAAPPFELGAVQLTVAEPTPATAPTPVGAPGTSSGVTALDDAEAAPEPRWFVAFTENVYAPPLVRPETTHDPAPVEVHVSPPLPEVVLSVAVTVYPEIAAPPFELGAAQLTVADAAAAVAVTPVGAPGRVEGVTAADELEDALDPCEFVAFTANVYASPLVRAVTGQLVAPVVVHVSPPLPEVVLSVLTPFGYQFASQSAWISARGGRRRRDNDGANSSRGLCAGSFVTS